MFQKFFPRRCLTFCLCFYAAFYSAKVQAQFTFVTNNGAITITGYNGTSGSMIIPSVTNGYPVVNIASNAFENNAIITNVFIAGSITNIGNAAFAGCYEVTNIQVDPMNGFYVSLGGVLFNQAQTILVQYPVGNSGKTYTIPYGVTNVGVSAFNECQDLTNINIPDSVVSIGDYAFSDCTSLTNFTIPGGVITIGDYAFYDCSRLLSIAFSNGVTSIGNRAFSYCASLTNVTLPTSVTTIGQFAFLNCTSLSSVTIPLGVTAIGDSAFSNCRRLLSVTIPATLTTIGNLVFHACAITNASIPDGVIAIGVGALSDTALKSLTVPNSVTNIGDAAFSQCPRLTAIYFLGNPPSLAGTNTFSSDGANARVYYLPGTTGWGPTYGGLPTVLWNPLAQTGDGSFGVRSNRFGFNITGTSNLVVVVEANANLADGVWTALSTNTLTNGTSYFSDLNWTNFPSRLYRIRSP